MSITASVYHLGLQLLQPSLICIPFGSATIYHLLLQLLQILFCKCLNHMVLRLEAKKSRGNKEGVEPQAPNRQDIPSPSRRQEPNSRRRWTPQIRWTKPSARTTQIADKDAIDPMNQCDTDFSCTSVFVGV
ncbi:hypothetical protein L6452_17632 [Arctium lappa]|uniref:Uncharacterized protein n=1 Tax=Arctium lappa TaxID=4217 RepID=A0ACB9C3T3_ARCLA|nr:hypothetical protein L6452_17632 [Arctium lappa]